MSTTFAVEHVPLLPREEFLERQERARALAAERGYSALLAWSRGASTQDRYADVLYLANFYTQFPFIPDEPGKWGGRGHTALVLPVEGPARLLVDVPQYRDDLVVADEVVTSGDVVGDLERLLDDAVPSGGRIGVLGTEAMSYRWHARLAAGRELVDADDLGPTLRLLKSPAEQDLLRAAGRLGVEVVEAVLDAAVSGVTEAEAVAAGVERLVAAGGALYGMGVSSGPYAHMYGPSQPAPYEGRHRLQEGDMFRLDAYGSVDGYLFDFGRSLVVGAEPTPEQQDMLCVVRDSVRAGIEAVAPGRTLGDVARACDAVYDASAFARSGRAERPALAAWGHSLGLAWERPWIDADSEVVIEPGMCLAIEKRVAVPGTGGATYEDDLLVTGDGYELLTPARDFH